MPTRLPRPRLTVTLLLAAVVLLTQLNAAAPHNFLWKASGKGGVIYLVGSVHLLTESSYPLDPSIEQAFNDADLLVEEVDLADMLSPDMQLSILMRSRLPEGQTLEQILSPSTMAALKTFTADMGPAADTLNGFKPWMLATVLEVLELQKAGFDPDLGLDKHFYDLAHGRKQIKGLETPDYQISLFDRMTMPEQDRFLAETLKELSTERSNFTKLTEAWKSGDAAIMEQIVLADLKSEPGLYQRLLVDRNRNWLPQLEGLFARPRSSFVVVGAAHLVGPDGLLQMLKSKGYTVEQM